VVAKPCSRDRESRDDNESVVQWGETPSPVTWSDVESIPRRLLPGARIPRGSNKFIWVVTAAAVVVLALVVGLNLGWIRAWLKVSHSPSSLPIARFKIRRSIAVIGFKNLSGRGDAAWLSPAMSDMLTTELAAGGQLRTISGESIARAKRDLLLSDIDSY